MKENLLTILMNSAVVADIDDIPITETPCERFFRVEHLFVPDPRTDERWLRAVEIWRTYYELTEDFDRRHCTGPVVRGGVTPRTREEAIAIAENARAVQALAARATMLYGLSDLMREAKEKACRESDRYTPPTERQPRPSPFPAGTGIFGLDPRALERERPRSKNAARL